MNTFRSIWTQTRVKDKSKDQDESSRTSAVDEVMHHLVVLHFFLICEAKWIDLSPLIPHKLLININMKNDMISSNQF
jgi:hypothetical protein